jgi:hypothetical protein
MARRECAEAQASGNPDAENTRDPQVIDHQGTGEHQHHDGVALLLIAKDRRETQAESQRRTEQ